MSEELQEKYDKFICEYNTLKINAIEDSQYEDGIEKIIYVNLFSTMRKFNMNKEYELVNYIFEKFNDDIIENPSFYNVTEILAFLTSVYTFKDKINNYNILRNTAERLFTEYYGHDIEYSKKLISGL